MKIAIATLVASALHIAVYLVVREFDIIKPGLNVVVLWSSLFVTCLISLKAALRETERR